MSRHKNLLLIFGIIFVAANLRTPLTSVGPLIGEIKSDTGITNSMAGLLTTLPLVIFAILSSVTSKLSLKIGNELTIFGGLFLTLLGVIIRSLGGSTSLFLGTFLIGLGIVTGNVLIPSIIKNRTPEKTGLMMSIYTGTMGATAGIFSGISYPLAQILPLGWRQALLAGGIFTAISIIIWLPQIYYKNTSQIIVEKSKATNSIWRSTLAWKVAFFMGLQSLIFYSIVAWLPEILFSRGLSMEMSGWFLSFYQIISLPMTFIIPIIAVRLKDQRGLTIGACLLYLVGVIGLLLSYKTIPLIISITVMGIGGGAIFSSAFSFITLRSKNGEQASLLSGMSQTIGYLLAAIGPTLIGFIFDFSGNWNYSILLWLLIDISLIYFAFGAGTNKYVFDE